jgi:hypothetical protein
MKYPIFIPSLGRWESCLTARLLLKDKIDFLLVVEEKEFEKYVKAFGQTHVLSLGGSDYGDVSYARNWIKERAQSLGFKRHWQIDDDIAGFMHVRNRVTLSESTDEILSAAENFVDHFTNVAQAGFSSSVFGRLATKPFTVNQLPYTCMLIKSDLPFTFTPFTVEDLDFTLQILSAGMCTVQFHMFLFKWSTTGTKKGGYTELNMNGGVLTRQQNTVNRWPSILSRIVKGTKGGTTRVYTNQVWKKFTQRPIKVCG